MNSAHPHKPFPILIGSREIYEGRVIRLRVDEIEVKDGLNVRREVVEHPGAVVMVPVDNGGRIYWVRQHRWAAKRHLLELPAGTLEPAEDPGSTARRELIEEVGMDAKEWDLLGKFFTAPGFCTEYMHAFLATSLSEAHADGDEDEDIEVVPLTLDESLKAIDDGQVEDAKSIAALMLYLRKNGRLG
jgi:ADP-ribose pyrophosphatase